MKDWFLIFILFSSLTSISQEVEISPVVLNGEQLPASIVGITQDNDGYLWLCDNRYGLFRFDGINLQQYSSQPGNPNSLTTNNTECLATDGENIWVGTFANGLNKFDPKSNQYTRYLHDPTDPSTIRSDHIRTLQFDDKGMLWIGTLHGVDKLDPNTGTFTHVHTQDPDEDILRSEHIRAMYFDRDGILWIGSSSPFPNEATVGGLFRFDTELGEIQHFKADGGKNSLKNNMVRAIFEDSRGVFWIGTAGDGLHTMDRESGIIKHHPYIAENPQELSRSPVNNTNLIDHITFINEDNEGSIWIGTFGGGLCRYDPVTEITEYYNTENTPFLMGSDGFWTSFKSRDNLLWVSTWYPTESDQFILKINGRPNRIKERQIQGTTLIRSFAEDNSGAIYFGTIDGVWKESLNGAMERILPLSCIQSGAGAGVRELEFDARGNLWLPTIRGVYKFDTLSRDLDFFHADTNSAFGLSHNNVRSVKYLGGDQLLVGSQGGLDLLNTETHEISKIEYNGRDSTIVALDIHKMLLDSYGEIWIAAGYKGPKRLDWKERQFKDYDFSTSWYTDIFEDSRKNLWFCTENEGLFSYNREQDRFDQVQDKRGLLNPSTSVFYITEDLEQNLWLVINGGLLRLDPESFETRLYGTSWGFRFAEVLGSFSSSSGEVFMGKGNGYYRFRPSDLEIVEFDSPEPFISQIYVDNEKIDFGSRQPVTDESIVDLLSLRHDQNNISFDIHHIDYLIKPGDAKLQYRLFGYEPKWHDSRSGDEIAYYNLIPGDYELRLRALDMNGNWRESSAQFTILKPWWRTWWAYALYAFILAFLGWRVHLFQKARVVRAEREKIREKELEQAREIEKAYHQLKSTQAQLVHAEKMASLGELTAGIAHEIQNPLNFVNNFSEVSSELVDDINDELKKGDPAAAIQLGKDLKQNLEKIAHHGDRAAAIVRSMLLHSRSDSGKRESVDINALTDEYLRLAYHGMRAKDKSFNVSMKTDFDSSLQKIELVPQDIGRVLLNLITNAFYAVSDKKKDGGNGFAPEVSVATRETKNFVEISVKDNGNGVPEHLIDKIFQPFFTTKPTGEGTGLGLSLSYDILKAHGGDIKMKSENGKGTEFTIQLPN